MRYSASRKVYCSAGGTHWASAQRTLFAWNNETLNAWTIILGVIVSLAGISYSRRASHELFSLRSIIKFSLQRTAKFGVAIGFQAASDVDTAVRTKEAVVSAQ